MTTMMNHIFPIEKREEKSPTKLNHSSSGVNGDSPSFLIHFYPFFVSRSVCAIVSSMIESRGVSISSSPLFFDSSSKSFVVHTRHETRGRENERRIGNMKRSEH